MNTEPITKILSEFSANLRYEDIPSEVIKKIKLDILDTIGCGLFGSTKRDVRLSREVLEERGGRKESTVWGTNLRLPCTNAALANSHAANSFELDDTYVYGGYGIHPGNNVVPAAIAISEAMEGIDGKSFLTAVVAGHEIAVRIREGMGNLKSPRVRGFNITAHCVTFGAAIAAGKILGLDAMGLLDAMGCAGSYIGGLLTMPPDSMAKRMVNGRAAHGGVLGALLAKKGFTGIRNILESKQGGYFLAYSDDPEPEKSIKKLGEEYICKHLHFKRYACFTNIHAPCDAAREIIAKYNVKADDVESILVRATSGALERSLVYDYETETSAQANLPYSVAMMFLEGQVLTDQFEESKLKDEDIRNFVRKIKGEADPEFEALGPDHRYTAKLEVKTNDGKLLKSSVIRGPQEMSEEEIKEKFRLLANKALDSKKAEKIIQTVDDLEDLENTKRFSNLLNK